MWPQLLNNIKAAPARVHERREEVTTWARERVSTARDTGRDKLSDLELRALERADHLLERGTDLPVVGRLVTPAAKRVHDRLAQRNELPIAGYGDLNVKAIAHELQSLDTAQLAQVREHELAGKNRKSVLQSIERELARHERGDA